MEDSVSEGEGGKSPLCIRICLSDSVQLHFHCFHLWSFYMAGLLTYFDKNNVSQDSFNVMAIDSQSHKRG